MFLKILCFSSKTKRFLEFSCILKDMGIAETNVPDKQMPVTKFFETLIPFSIVCLPQK